VEIDGRNDLRNGDETRRINTDGFPLTVLGYALTSSMNTLSALSAFAVKSLFCVSFSRPGRRPSSSSLPIEDSALSVPTRGRVDGGPAWFPDGGCDECMSFETIIRPVATSHSRSQDPDDSKIGFVTPAMYAGLVVGQVKPN
jgi:hypothetical protein